jgi:hypothetical protein
MIQKSTSKSHPQALASDPQRSRRRWLLAIFGTALLGRFMAFSSFIARHPHDWIYGHPFEMGLLANSLVHGQGLSSPFGSPTGPTAFIAPGYPTLIAAVFLIFGSYTFLSAIVIMLLQIMVALLTIWLMMRVAREVLNLPTAYLAGAFWAVSLPLLWIPFIFWETSLSACAFIGIVALALRCSRNPTTAYWVLIGAACAGAALVNPALLPSLLGIMGWIAWQTRRVNRIAPAIGLLVLTVLFAPWPIRNAVRFHAFIPLRSTVGFELWMGNRPGSDGFLDESVFPMFNRQEFANYVSMGEVAYTNAKSAQAWEYIHAHPGAFLNLSARRFFRFWMGRGNADGNIVYAIHAGLTTLLGIAGLVLIYRRGNRSFAILMAIPILLFPLPYYITHAEFRYRLNIDPLMTVLAAYAAMQMVVVWSRYRSARKARFEQHEPVHTYAEQPGYLGFEAVVFPPPA